MADVLSRTYTQPRDRLFDAARTVLANAGHRITALDEDSGLITFETTPSTGDRLFWGSSGQKVSLMITERSPGVGIVQLTGQAQNPFKPAPNQFGGLAESIFDAMDAALAGAG